MFFEQTLPDARGIADPDKVLYDAFAVERGGFREMFGVGPWIAGLRAVAKGHFIGRKLGDPWTLPTIVAIRNESVVWEFVGRHAGDHPDLDDLPQILAGT